MAVQKKPPRKNIPVDRETAVLINSGRRCVLCFHLNRDLEEKHGLIAHLDGDRTNRAEDKLAWTWLHGSDQQRPTVRALFSPESRFGRKARPDCSSRWGSNQQGRRQPGMDVPAPSQFVRLENQSTQELQPRGGQGRATQPVCRRSEGASPRVPFPPRIYATLWASGLHQDRDGPEVGRRRAASTVRGPTGLR